MIIILFQSQILKQPVKKSVFIVFYRHFDLFLLIFLIGIIVELLSLENNNRFTDSNYKNYEF